MNANQKGLQNVLKMYPYSIQEKQIWGNVELYHLLTNGSSAVNGCRQNESLNTW